MDLKVFKLRKNSKINGSIDVSGAKNSSVAILPAALLCSEEVILHNIPDISDINIEIDIIKKLGHFVTFKDNTVVLRRNDHASYIFPDEVSLLRGSYYFIGAYLAYFGKIAMKSSGGCDLGSRPTNFHHDAFLALNAKYKREGEYDVYKCSKIKGTTINLEFPSVGATINILLASIFCTNETVIYNYAKEIEVLDVINFLNSMGGCISGYNTEKLVIKGVKKLHKTNYTIISDRIEAGTYLAFGCLKENSSVTVNGINPSYLESFLDVLEKIGHEVIKRNNSITVKCGVNLKSVNVVSGVYPNFPTDLGPIIVVLLSLIDGVSTFTETIFKNRFNYVSELNKMNASITIKDNTLIINGKTNYQGSCVIATDLRASAALLLASTIASSNTVIKNIEYLKRGYEDVYNKLSKLKIKCEEKGAVKK